VSVVVACNGVTRYREPCSQLPAAMAAVPVP